MTMKTDHTCEGAPASAERSLGLYIHIPFCLERCYYCDFLTFPHAERFHAPYVEALKKEIRCFPFPSSQQERAMAEAFSATSFCVDSVYIGGGTPTLLPVASLQEILDTLRERFCFSPSPEITVEANPGTFSSKDIQDLLKAGVNRVSLGVQSFSDPLLVRIGRTHTKEQVEEDIALLRDAGLKNLNLDLILGLPGQTTEDIQHDLSALERWHPEHVSWYSLILEEKTYFHFLVQKGRLALPDDETLVKWLTYVVQGLQEQGYDRYEISNFAKPGYASHHNLKYWSAKDYLGFGVGAASYFLGERYRNTDGIHAYVDGITAGRSPRAFIARTREDDLFEQIMMGLRKIVGMDRAAFLTRNGSDVTAFAPHTIRQACANDLMTLTPSHLAFTEKGFFIQNDVLSDMLLEHEEK